MRSYTWFWIVWLGVGVAYEMVALFNQRQGDTLSENVWALMARKPVWAWIICGFLAWMLVHFLSRGKWG